MSSNSINDPVFTVKEMLTRLETKVDKVIDDHEVRLRGLESDKNQRRGAYALVMSFVAFAAAVAAVVGMFMH